VEVRIHFTAEDLARTRLVPGPAPFFEAVYGACRLVNDYQDPYFTRWLHHARDALGSALRPTLALLYSPIAQDSDLVSRSYQGSLEHAIDTMRDIPPRQLGSALQDLTDRVPAAQWPNWAPNPTTNPSQVLDLLARALQIYHHAALAPYWPQLERAATADHANHSTTVAELGVHELLRTLSPDLTWEHPTLSYAFAAPTIPRSVDVYLKGRGLLLLPSVFLRRAAGLWLQYADPEAPPVLTYPVNRDIRTTPWACHESEDGGVRLGALLGTTRASLLRTLASGPLTTTQVAARLRISPASASEHATVLHDTGLTTRQSGPYPLRWTPDEIAAVPEHRRLTDGFDPKALHR
jgi:hypothetical protein